jgi:hypothetical protein
MASGGQVPVLWPACLQGRFQHSDIWGKDGGSMRKRKSPPLPKIMLCAHPDWNEHYPAFTRSASCDSRIVDLPF